MSIIEDAKAELDAINFGEEESAVMLEILRTFFDHSVVSPIRSGIGSYRTREQAITEAREWAECEGYPVDVSEAP